MVVFVDTSALYAIIDANDPNCSSASAFWSSLLTQNAQVVCSNYVVVEACALLQQRFGLAAVRKYHDDIAPALTVKWIDRPAHDEALTALLSTGKRELSLVDCTSFALMRQLGIKDVFAFDPHFAEQGFDVLPAPTSD